MAGRVSYGLRAPLFDRLSKETDMPVVLEGAELAESIRTALLRLFGSRAYRDVREYLAAPPSVAAYGVPDTVDYTAGALSDRQLMARSLEMAVRAFEPRLSDIAIEIEPTRDRTRPLAARLTASVRMQGYERPLVFLLNGPEVTLLGAPK